MPSFETSDGLNLHFNDLGEGPPVLCLAGLTRNGDDFGFMAPHLAEIRLIMLDSRGRGLSDFDPSYANYNVMREAQDVLELLNHLELERAAIIGTSRGGLLGMMLAAGNPDRISALVLNDVGPVIDTDGVARILDYVGKPPTEHSLAEAAEVMQMGMGPKFPGVKLARWKKLAAAIYAESGDGLRLRYDPMIRQAMVEQLEAGPVGDLWPLYDTLRDIPMGVIRGANSDILTDDTVQMMKTRHSNLVVGTVPDRGHAPFLDEPEALTVIRTVLEIA